MEKLPIVLATSVIRASNKGESHGGLYVIDLETERYSQIIDWDKIDIDWNGRGLDRGMRGIAHDDNYIYTAISDEILVYDYTFTLVKRVANKYLKHCHEIQVQNGKLYLTSTGFDSILEYDLKKEQFINGYCVRYPATKELLNKMIIRFNLDNCSPRLLPDLRRFDPNNQDDGPLPGDSLHINNVHVKAGRIFLSGRRFGSLLTIQSHRLASYCSIPYFTHNARPYLDGVLANHTRQDRIVFLNKKQGEVERYTIPRYENNQLTNNKLPDSFARQGFGRGLCCEDGFIIAGSSPATVSLYRRGKAEPLKSVNLSMDVRNAIHGLEIMEDNKIMAAISN
jgi:hypothetical protein